MTTACSVIATLALDTSGMTRASRSSIRAIRLALRESLLWHDATRRFRPPGALQRLRHEGALAREAVVTARRRRALTEPLAPMYSLTMASPVGCEAWR